MIATIAWLSTSAQAEANGNPPPEVQQMRRVRWLNSEDQLLVAPYYSIGENRAARLILVNRFAEAIDYDIQLVAPSGRAYPLGGDRLRPREILELDLGEDLPEIPEEFKRGSLEVRYFGDPEMAQAWMALSNSSGSMVVPLTKVTSSWARQWISFWDFVTLKTASDPMPVFVSRNTGATPLVLNLSWRTSSGVVRGTKKALGPFQTAIVKPPAPISRSRSGSLIIRHDGEPGQVAVAGFAFEDSMPSSSLPLATDAELDASNSFEGFGLPRVEGVRSVLSVLDARQSGKPRLVRISLVEQGTGSLSSESELMLQPGRVERLDLSSLVSGETGGSLMDLRPRVFTDEGHLLASIVSVMPDGSLVESALLPTAKTHASGTYPVPSTETHEVVTTLLNLGEESAQLFGHFVSDQGEYALQPIEVPAGGTHRLSFSALISEERTDRLGRRLEPGSGWGFFQWFSRRGSKELLARTEVRKRGDSDTIGFNCFGCCAEFPSGSVIPESIAFDLGQSPSFEAVEWVNTCAGLTGPYYAYPTTLSYSAPVSWNGQVVSSSDYTNQNAAFEGSGEYMQVNCQTTTRNFFGGGIVTVDTCLDEHGPEGYDPAQEAGGCPGQTSSCSECYTCCEQIQDVAECRCAFGGDHCTALAAQACKSCKDNCFGKFTAGCATQDTSCN